MKNGQKKQKKLEFRRKNKENRQKAGLKSCFWAWIGTNRDESAFLGRRAGRRVSVSKSGLSRRDRDGWQVCYKRVRGRGWTRLGSVPILCLCSSGSLRRWCTALPWLSVSCRDNREYGAGERVDLLDSYDFPARTITETETKTWSSFWYKAAADAWLDYCTLKEIGMLLLRLCPLTECLLVTGTRAGVFFFNYWSRKCFSFCIATEELGRQERKPSSSSAIGR